MSHHCIICDVPYCNCGDRFCGGCDECNEGTPECYTSISALESQAGETPDSTTPKQERKLVDSLGSVNVWWQLETHAVNARVHELGETLYKRVSMPFIPPVMSAVFPIDGDSFTVWEITFWEEHGFILFLHSPWEIDVARVEQLVSQGWTIGSVLDESR